MTDEEAASTAPADVYFVRAGAGVFLLKGRDLERKGYDGEGRLWVEDVVGDEVVHLSDGVSGVRIVPPSFWDAEHGIAKDLCRLDGLDLGSRDAKGLEEGSSLFLGRADGGLAERGVFAVGQEEACADGFGDGSVGAEDAIGAVDDPVFELQPVGSGEGGPEAEVVAHAADKTLFEGVEHEGVF